MRGVRSSLTIGRLAIHPRNPNIRTGKSLFFILHLKANSCLLFNLIQLNLMNLQK